MADSKRPVVVEARPRQGMGTRIYNFVVRLFNGPPKPYMRSKGKDSTDKTAPGFFGDEGQNLYSFYGERMRLGKTRQEIYDELDAMDSDDLPSATLDTYAEDATPRDAGTGMTFWIEDCSDDIQKECMECLERIQAEEFGFLIARNLGKYGDFPVELYWEPGEGVNLLRFHHPKRFRRFEEQNTGILVGFHLGDGAFSSSEPNKQPWEIVHFRVFGSLSAMYGTSLLINARRAYRRLRLSEDGDVIYRLQRHPDRDVFYVDCTGMTDTESADYLERFRVAMKTQKYYDSEKGELREDWNPFTNSEDLLVPMIQGRETKIERLKGSANAGEASNLNYYLARYHSSVRIPPAFFGYAIQGSQPYDPQKNLSQQDDRYAKIPSKLQRYILLGVHRILQLNLAFKAIDPTEEDNKFTVAMAPVTYLGELHRQQLIEVRIDIIDRLLNMGQQVGFDMQVWIRYVLKQYGKLSDTLIEELMVNAPAAPAEPGADAPGGDSLGGPPMPPPELPGPDAAATGMPVGEQPLTGTEFENLPVKTRALLTELAKRVLDSNKLVEDSKMDSGQALRHFGRGNKKAMKEIIEKKPTKGGDVVVERSEGAVERSEDVDDFMPDTEEEEGSEE